MFNSIPRPHYFSHPLGREVREVYWHSILNSLALSLVYIFEPIFLWTLGFSLVSILWFYVQVYTWYILFVTLGAKFAGRFGYKHSILLSNLIYVIYWIVLFSVSNVPILYYFAPIFFALQKSFFWPAWNADVALASARTERGREMGVLYSLIQISFIAGPFLGGFISEKFGFFALFISASFLIIFSVYPLFKSPEIHSSHQFHFEDLWKIFRAFPRNFVGYFGYAEDLMFQSLWPVFMFVIISDVSQVGTVSTVATLVGTVLMLYIGKLTDRIKKHVLVWWASMFYGLTWIFRFLGQSLAGVLVFDALTKTGKDLVNVPMVALTFERVAKSRDFAIAYSVFVEFSLSVGKILMALAAIWILSAGLSIFWVFALAGAMTMFYGLLR